MFKNKEIKFNLFFIKIFGLLLIYNLIPIQAIANSEKAKINLDTTYLESKGELDDYILDTGDVLNINFIDLPELSRSASIDAQGEIFLDRVNETYVRGLTIDELENLLEQKYQQFLTDPEIEIRLQSFKPIRISITGEIRNPGIIRFSGFKSSTSLNFSTKTNLIDNNNQRGIPNNSESSTYINNQLLNLNNNSRENSENSSNDITKRTSDFVSTISNAINKAGGLTSYSDIKRIELIREVPISKGGGKKKAIIDFSSFLDNSNTDMDLRLFDGDTIYIPRSKVPNKNIIRKSILAGLTPNFIQVVITGKIENPGIVKIPVEGTLSDVMNITGPRKPLSGKIFLIRYGRDGTLIRENIRFSANASAGTKKNPYLLDGDIVSVKNSLFGRSAGIISEVIEPFVGVYATKELIESF